MSEPVPLLDRKLDDGSPAYFQYMSQYGKARGGVTRAAVSAWHTRDGLIAFATCPVTGKQVVDAVASDERRLAHQNPLKRQADAPAALAAPVEDPAGEDLFQDAEPPAAEEISPAEPAPKPARVEDPFKRSAAEAVSRDKWLAVRQREMKLRQEMGELARVEDMQDALFQAMRRVRDAMQSVAAECCERANPDDPSIARRAIQEEVDKKLTAVALEVERLLAGAEEIDLPEIGAAPETADELIDA
jgi:hypothetical protein